MVQDSLRAFYRMASLLVVVDGLMSSRQDVRVQLDLAFKHQLVLCHHFFETITAYGLVVVEDLVLLADEPTSLVLYVFQLARGGA